MDHLKGYIKSHANILVTILIGIVVLEGYLAYQLNRDLKYSDILLPKLSLYVNDSNDYADISGSWILQTPEELAYLYTLNTVSIECRKQESICYEVWANLGSDPGEDTSLGPWFKEYQILSWDENEIKAVEHLPVRTDELRINLIKKTATLVQTELASETSSASSYPFVLNLGDGEEAINKYKKNRGLY